MASVTGFHLALFASAPIPEIVAGDGVELVDRDGRRYLDACSGAISVNSLGYGNLPIETIQRLGREQLCA